MVEKLKKVLFILFLVMCSLTVGCEEGGGMAMRNNAEKTLTIEKIVEVAPTEKITSLEDGLSTVSFNGNYEFDRFLTQGGASSDADVIGFLTEYLLSDASELKFEQNAFGCSTIAVEGENGERFFGRNFDWNKCEAMVVLSKPENGYQSVSTVNLDFIRKGTKGVMGLVLKSQKIQTIAALYAPLDGMNEKGFCVSVNMIEDSDTIEQNTEKSDLTTTTAIRLLLDKAANVEEAITLLNQYDIHASMGMMVHFALADADGNSVVIEYVNNEMVITETPVVTNFYLAEGSKNGIGTEQSHERYNILMDCFNENIKMSVMDVKKALDSVSKDNFNEFESTEWSIVFNQQNGEVRYYHRENYDNAYLFRLE